MISNACHRTPYDVKLFQTFLVSECGGRCRLSHRAIEIQLTDMTTSVLHLCRSLDASPRPAAPLPGVTIRCFRPEDVDRWLALRQRAFAREKLGVREWSAADFEEEFLTKPWWNPAHCWLAEATSSNFPADQPVAPGVGQATSPLLGAVAMALRGQSPTAKAVVHWLMVEPRFRRRGIAHQLMNTLEAAAYAAGYREVHLETHAAWTSAAEFYTRLGYRPVR